MYVDVNRSGHRLGRRACQDVPSQSECPGPNRKRTVASLQSGPAEEEAAASLASLWSFRQVHRCRLACQLTSVRAKCRNGNDGLMLNPNFEPLLSADFIMFPRLWPLSSVHQNPVRTCPLGHLCQNWRSSIKGTNRRPTNRLMRHESLDQLVASGQERERTWCKDHGSNTAVTWKRCWWSLIRLLCSSWNIFSFSVSCCLFPLNSSVHCLCDDVVEQTRVDTAQCPFPSENNAHHHAAAACAQSPVFDCQRLCSSL